MDEAVDELVARLRQRIAVLEGQLGKARGAVHDRDEFLRRAFEDAPIGMALVGLDERIVEANAALCQMLGYTREQLLQKTVPEITHPEDVIKEAEPKGDMQDGAAASFLIEKRYLRSDGSELLGRLSVSALYDEHAKPAYFIGQLEDVTRERAAEQALRERETLFRALIESTSEIICIVDSAATFRFVSSRVSSLGWSVAQLVGEPFERLLVPDDAPRFAASLDELLSERIGSLRMDVRLRRGEGGERRFELAGHNLRGVAAISGVVLTLRDVTEQRSMQAQLSQAQRLDSLARLVGGVAHDFNNMLGVILGTAELLGMSLDGDDPRRTDVDMISETAQRASALTRQLLAIGRRSHGAPQAIDVDGVLERMRGLLVKVLGEDIELALELGAGASAIVIDPAQLEQVVLNFATNARDAMPQGGRFTLRTSTRSFDREHAPAGLEAGRWLELQALDDGMGMEREICEHIFDPFFTTKQGERGTGLGLATVYGIVQQAGGHVCVESEPGRGTCFSVWWPEVAAVEVARTDSSPRARERGVHVLLVEDDASVRQVNERILRHGGHQVTAVGDPVEALARVRAGLAFDIVVTDVVMPHMSGPELHEQLVALRGELPVVFVSGYAKAAVSELSVHPGFLPKPFSAEALLSKLGERLMCHAPRSKS